MERTREKKPDVYAMVTNRIMEQLEKGTVPWKQPWAQRGMPQNLITRKLYRGINTWMLASCGYAKNYFLSFKQLKDIGGRLKKGEKSNMVVFWKKEEKEDKEEKGKLKVFSFLRYYTVFNVAQCLDIPQDMIPTVEKRNHPIDTCEEIIEEMPNCPEILHRDNKAYYSPVHDHINMPSFEDFDYNESYYGTLFHELIHSTGHEKRLNRKEITQKSQYGSRPYSQEELTAEIGACFLKSYAGLEEPVNEQNAAYIQGWLKRLQGDNRFIFSASSQAQKAVDYILNFTMEEKAESQVTGEPKETQG